MGKGEKSKTKGKNSIGHLNSTQMWPKLKLVVHKSMEGDSLVKSEKQLGL